MNIIEKIEDIEDEIECLQNELFKTIPFKRSQAWSWGDDTTHIDAWEKEVEEKLLHKENILRSYMMLCK